MLKKTKVNLELISDNSVLEFFEQQIRGDVLTVFHRYTEVNNKELPKYDPKRKNHLNRVLYTLVLPNVALPVQVDCIWLWPQICCN